MLFETRRSIVNAEQFLPGEPVPEGVKTWVCEESGERKFQFQSGEKQPIPIFHCDWIVRYENGNAVVMQTHRFVLMFKPVAPTNITG